MVSEPIAPKAARPVARKAPVAKLTFRSLHFRIQELALENRKYRAHAVRVWANQFLAAMRENQIANALSVGMDCGGAILDEEALDFLRWDAEHRASIAAARIRHALATIRENQVWIETALAEIKRRAIP